MSFAKTHSGQSYYLKGQIIDVEIDVSRGLHSFSIVGLPDKAIEESRDRVSAAIKNSGFVSPKQKNHRVVISLAPAHIPKEGSHFDLAMALGYLIASGDAIFNPTGKVFVGELSLDGRVRKVRGVLAIILEAKHAGFTEIFIPQENAGEARLVHGIKIIPVSSLREVIDYITGRCSTPKYFQTNYTEKETELNQNFVQLEEIIGHDMAKRGLQIAAAGGHNILMTGPPGTGKTMLAHSFQGLVPMLSEEHALEATSIHSIAGLTNNLVTSPPFRAPHHTSSYSSLIGGGNIPRPGEITLAHRGILFLDEFSEFDRRAIETLRQPLEEHVINITRSRGCVYFPAHFILIAATNPCPCGFHGSQKKMCVCPANEIIKYKKKISGPILDRIDLRVEVGDVDYGIVNKISTAPKQKTQATETKIAKEKIVRARAMQADRFEDRFNSTSIEQTQQSKKLNSEMKGEDLTRLSKISISANQTLVRGAEAFNLSMRSYHRAWRVARTIADLEGSEKISEEHVLEALQYRKF